VEKFPILFIIFNRFDTSLVVLDSIRNYKPKNIYISADGPRLGNPTDEIQCNLTRSSVLDAIDWDCECKTLFHDTNLGCGKAVSTALDWFFSEEPEGIILEDDCVPDPFFFRYCEFMLDAYRKDLSIGHISGVNLYGDNAIGHYGHSFSSIPHVWGWASWSRAWKGYSQNPKGRRELVFPSFYTKADRSFWTEAFRKLTEEGLDTWDYQWVFHLWENSMLSVMPDISLVRNIGFDERATHTHASITYKTYSGENIVLKKIKRLKINEKKERLILDKMENIKPKKFGHQIIALVNSLSRKMKKLWK